MHLMFQIRLIVDNTATLMFQFCEMYYRQHCQHKVLT